MLKRTSTILAIVAMATLAITALSANAAPISVDGSASWNSGGSPIVGNFDASGSAKLVVIVTGEHGFNQTGGGDGGAVTYDGVAMTQVVNRQAIKPVTDPVTLADDTWNDIWYLDNPAAGPGLISAIATSRGTVTAIALSGTAAGVGNTAISPRDTSSVGLTTSAGSIVIASYGMGGSGNTARVGNVDWDGDVEVSAQSNGVWDGHVTGYTNDVAAGTATYSFTDTNAPGGDGRTGANTIAAEFTAVPEPATMSLLVLGGLGLLRRRRKA